MSLYLAPNFRDGTIRIPPDGGSKLKPKAKRARRHVTIREVAKAAGASVSTISAALNNSDYVSAEMRSRISKRLLGLSELHGSHWRFSGKLGGRA